MPRDYDDYYEPRKPKGASPVQYYQSNSQFLKAEDLKRWALSNGKPERRLMIIKDWEERDGFEDGDPPIIQLSFDLPETDSLYGKKLGLNKTNHDRLMRLIGVNEHGEPREYEEWRGYAFQLLISTTKTRTQPSVECLRVNEGIIYTPKQVNAMRSKGNGAQTDARPAPPPSVIVPPHKMTTNAAATTDFDDMVPPDELDEPFNDQF